MKLSFLGATRQVTGSRYVLDVSMARTFLLGLLNGAQRREVNNWSHDSERI